MKLDSFLVWNKMDKLAKSEGKQETQVHNVNCLLAKKIGWKKEITVGLAWLFERMSNDDDDDREGIRRANNILSLIRGRSILYLYPALYILHFAQVDCLLSTRHPLFEMVVLHSFFLSHIRFNCMYILSKIFFKFIYLYYSILYILIAVISLGCIQPLIRFSSSAVVPFFYPFQNAIMQCNTVCAVTRLSLPLL